MTGPWGASPDEIDLAHRELARQQRRLDLIFLRLLLQQKVRHVLLLVYDTLAGERHRLESLLLRFRPSTLRSRWAPGGQSGLRRTHWRHSLPHPWRPQYSQRQSDLLFRDAMSGRGLVVRPPSHARGALGLFALDDQLEVEFGLGIVRGWSRGEEAFVVVRGALPESVGLAIVGLPIGELTDRPVLVGRDYRITGCRIHDAEDAEGASTTIRFRTGRSPFRMPFASVASDLARISGARRRKEPA